MARILVAEDERYILRMLSIKLEGMGHEVITAEDGGAALERAMEEIPDLILLDVMMPVMNGFEVLNRLKGTEQTKNIPVIFVTAMGSERDMAAGIEAGAADYVTKPFNFGELTASINYALAGNPPAKAD